MIKSVENSYVMIPNMIVQSINYGEEVELSYINLLGKRTVLYLRQLLELQNVKGYSYFSINMILWMSRMQTNIQRERKLFKETLIKLRDASLIACSDDIDIISANDFIKVQLDVYEHNGEGKANNYFKLLDSEFNTIMSGYKGNLDRFNLLNLFCNLKSRMRNNAKDVPTSRRIPEVCFPSYETIKNDIDIRSDKTLKQYIDALVELDLIRYGCAGDRILVKDNKITRRNSNFTYTLYTKGWEKDLEDSIIAYKVQKGVEGWKFLTKEKGISANQVRAITQKINILERSETITENQMKELVKLKQEKEELLILASGGNFVDKARRKGLKLIAI